MVWLMIKGKTISVVKNEIVRKRHLILCRYKDEGGRKLRTGKKQTFCFCEVPLLTA